MSRSLRFAMGMLVLMALSSQVQADDGWIDLSAGKDPWTAWRKPTGKWFTAKSVEIDPANSRRLKAVNGEGIIVNGPRGNTHNLLTKRKFRDVEVHVEFFIPKHSNSGVKLEGLYEIQIYDSYGKKHPTGADCGGIYPRAEEQPRYHHIDNGVPPRVNACRPPGTWQTLDIVFRAPRFDKSGHKTANARFLKVVLNGQLIHKDVEVRYPTGAAWRLKKEVPAGPLLLQADHGPVAFRNVRMRPIP
jgi:hypothetical protein